MSTSNNHWETPFQTLNYPVQNKIDLKTDTHGILSLVQQQRYINSLPNHHKWPFPGVDSSKLKYEQRFSTSTRYHPGSPRNRILQAWSHYRQDSDDVIFDVLYNIFFDQIPLRYMNRRERKSARHENKGKGSRKRAHKDAFDKKVSVFLIEFIIHKTIHST